MRHGSDLAKNGSDDEAEENKCQWLLGVLLGAAMCTSCLHRCRRRRGQRVDEVEELDKTRSRMTTRWRSMFLVRFFCVWRDPLSRHSELGSTFLAQGVCHPVGSRHLVIQSNVGLSGVLDVLLQSCCVGRCQSSLADVV